MGFTKVNNGNIPIADPITEMGVAHAFELGLAAKLLTLLSWEQENILLELRSTFFKKFFFHDFWGPISIKFINGILPRK